jgi:hypothetical protein
MSKSKIISLSIYFIMAAIVIFFAYGTVKNRYFPSEEKKTESALPNAEQPSATTPDVNSSGDPAVEENQDNSEQSSDQANADAQKAAAEGSHLYVTSKDCDKNCDKWKDNADDLKYCQEVCGIIPATQKGSKDECSSLEGLEKDYCLRDVAVSKTDIDICEEIKDARVKKVCKSRIVEDLLN